MKSIAVSIQSSAHFYIGSIEFHRNHLPHTKDPQLSYQYCRDEPKIHFCIGGQKDHKCTLVTTENLHSSPILRDNEKMPNSI